MAPRDAPRAGRGGTKRNPRFGFGAVPLAMAVALAPPHPRGRALRGLSSFCRRVSCNSRRRNSRGATSAARLPVPVRAGGQRQRAAAGHRLHGVDQEIAEHLQQALRVTSHARESTRPLGRIASQQMAERIRAAGGEAECVVLDGKTHFTANHELGMPNGGEEISAVLLRFVRREAAR